MYKVIKGRCWPFCNKFWSSEFHGILIAVLIALLFRIFLFEPFHIPSSSMKPGLLIGDYIFVNKMSYGYGKYSIPFHPDFITKRIFTSQPKRGDVAVFIPPMHQDKYYIKRVVGLPGDKITIKEHKIFVNDERLSILVNGFFNDKIEGIGDVVYNKYNETNLDNKEYQVMYLPGKPSLIDAEYTVPEGSLFVMGDNRDNSKDSRYLDDVGYIPQDHLVGKASIIMLSINTDIDWSDWHQWSKFIRFERSFNPIK